MGLGDTFKGYVLFRPTADEVALLNGKTGREYVDFYRDMQNTDGINPNHFKFFQRMTNDLSDAINWQRIRFTNTPTFESDLLKNGAFYGARSTGTTTEELRRSSFLSLNFVTVSINETGFFSAMLSGPVKWNFKHLQEQIKERNGLALKETDPLFFNHNAVAMTMLHIFEEMQDETQLEYRPFALPHGEGLLLGHTVNEKNHNCNRLALMAPMQGKELATSRYEWCPEMLMTVRTYIGPDKMSPEQKALRNNLSRFYGGSRIKGLSLELELVDNVVANPGFHTHPEFPSYSRAYMELEEIIKSPEWNTGVRLARHLKPNNPSSSWEP